MLSSAKKPQGESSGASFLSFQKQSDVQKRLPFGSILQMDEGWEIARADIAAPVEGIFGQFIRQMNDPPAPCGEARVATPKVNPSRQVHE